MSSPPVRVVHLADYGGSYPGSFIPMLQAARDAVEGRGWTFAAGFSNGAQRHSWFTEPQARGVSVREFPALGRGGLIRRVAGMLGEPAARTLVHTHFTTFDAPAVLAGARRPGTRVLWHLHTPLPDGPLAVARNVLRLGGFGRLTTRILCVGPEILDRALARAAPSGRTELMGNGIDVASFPTLTPGERSDARARLGLPEAGDIVLLFAWDWERKGGALLIETLAELERRGRSVTAVIVGAGDTGRRAAAQSGVDRSIRWLAPRDDTRSLYAAADLMIAASTAEGMPFALLEALCCGTPVVASDIPSHRYVAADLPGCTLAPRLPGAFADALTRELDADDIQRLARMATTRSAIESSRSLTAWSGRLMGIYADVLTQ